MRYKIVLILIYLTFFSINTIKVSSVPCDYCKKLDGTIGCDNLCTFTEENNGFCPDCSIIDCGNGYCEIGEDYTSCPSDCPLPCTSTCSATDTFQCTSGLEQCQMVGSCLQWQTATCLWDTDCQTYCGANTYCSSGSCTAKKANGVACNIPDECSSGFCVNHICRSTSTFCGDNVCDPGENCGTGIDCANPTYTCTSGVCTVPPECTSDTQCPADTTCINNYCDASSGTCKQTLLTGSCGVVNCPTGASGSCTKTCSGGSCQSCTPACTETNCNDGMDNDADGKIDCIDTDCAFAPACIKCTDNDKDGFNISAPNCGPADCDDDKSNDPAGCPTTKSGCKESTSKCAICINDDANEYCDFIDNNCDGQIDGSSVCTCEKLLGLGKTGKAKISFPADNANFFAGTSVSFIAEKNTLITAYRWDFGNGQSDVNDKGSSAATYMNKGDYAAKLNIIDGNHCEDIASINLKINPCQKKEDCEDNQICQNGLCRLNETTQITPLTDQPLTITIHSPTNQLYAQKIVPLSIAASRPSECSYSLNSADHVKITANTKTIEGREGLNTLKIRCNETIASAQFTVKLSTQPASIISDVKDDVEGTSTGLFGSLKDKGELMTTTAEQAKEVISEMLDLGALKIEKSRQLSGSKSLIMLSIRNLLPITLENAKLDVTIPKSIANTAAEIQSVSNFTIIQNDPVIEFNIASIAKDYTLMFELNKIIDEKQLGDIQITTKEDLNSLLKKQQETADAAKITKEFEEYSKDGETYTKIKTRITPKKGLKGMSVIEKIPKCLAKQIDYLKMDERYRSQIKIINPDPLIMWQFEEITSEKYFEYEVKGILSEDCRKQIKSLGIADELGLDIESRDYFSIILPLMVIPLLGLVVVRLHKFSNVMKKKEEDGAKEEKQKEKKPEKKQEQRPRMIEKGEDREKFLQEEIEEAEREFKRKLK